MPFTGPIEDRTAIRELHETVADAASRLDRAGWLGCYADDAVWKTHYFEEKGIAAIAAKYDEITASATDITFSTQIGSIEVTGDTARTRAYCSESLLLPGGATYDLVGEYDDELVRRDGKWLFRHRTYKVKREKAP